MLLAVGGWAIAGKGDELAPRPSRERPAIALVTSLPIVFGERFSLDEGGSPALDRLSQRYEVRPIGVADAANLRGHRLLLMAHPRAQPASALVELDQWVRGGGRLLLLADPKLDWPSERPFGDRLRPPPAFADTGLLSHWGLELTGPAPMETAGRLTGKNCTILEDGFIARCRIGRGKATVLADADFINVDASSHDDLGILAEELNLLESR